MSNWRAIDDGHRRRVVPWRRARVVRMRAMLLLRELPRVGLDLMSAHRARDEL